MRSKRLVAVVSLVLGIGITLATGSLLRVDEASAKSARRYTCLRMFDVDTTIGILNLEDKEAHITIDRGIHGTEDKTIPAGGFIFENLDNNAQWGVRALKVTSDRSLLLDGEDYYVWGPGDTTVTQIRCT